MSNRRSDAVCAKELREKRKDSLLSELLRVSASSAGQFYRRFMMFAY